MLKTLPFIILFGLFTQFSFAQNLKVITVNVWSGLDYNGSFKFGEYETEKIREKRFNSLLTQIKKESPDILFLQEVNPAGKYTSRLAQALGFDEIHHVCNAGLKIGPVGIPSNTNEGIAILARPEYKMNKFDVWKLSGYPGINGDYINIHFGDAEYALVGKILINDVPLYLINVHLFAAIGKDSSLKSKLDSLYKNNIISEDDYKEALKEWNDGIKRQQDEVRELLENNKKLSDYPVIIAGDFNSVPDSYVINKLENSGKFFNTFLKNYYTTWAPDKNSNINLQYENSGKKNAYEILTDIYDKYPRTIDYIFLNNKFVKDDVEKTSVIFDSNINGVLPSDHFGVLSEINISNVLKNSAKETDEIIPVNDTRIDPFPIVNYDSDAGIGYGAKGFALNFLKMNESFDLLLYNSTKGERWYRFVLSLPDYNIRQFKRYPFSFDIIVDYHKWLNANFFGIGNRSVYEDESKYVKEALEVSAVFGRAFTKELILQAGLNYSTIDNSEFTNLDSLKKKYPILDISKSSNVSLFLTFRYDTKDSYIMPSKGSVVQLETEYTPGLEMNNAEYKRLGLWLQQYFTIGYPKTVLAMRFGLNSLFGENIPMQNLLSLGGNSNLRGSVKNRYQDKVSAIFNTELRFPIYWRFSGILGIDAGKVWSSLDKIDLKRWSVNPVFGLRLNMNTFLVRFDLGMGKETTGIYFNFGHIF